jgi:hypothetical protein
MNDDTRRAPTTAKAYLAWVLTGFVGGHRAYLGHSLALGWLLVPFACTALLLSEIASSVPLYVLLAVFAFTLAEGFWLWQSVDKRKASEVRRLGWPTKSAYASGAVLLVFLAPGFLILTTDLIGITGDPGTYHGGREGGDRIPMRFLVPYEAIPATRPLAAWLHSTSWLMPSYPKGTF